MRLEIWLGNEMSHFHYGVAYFDNGNKAEAKATVMPFTEEDYKDGTNREYVNRVSIIASTLTAVPGSVSAIDSVIGSWFTSYQTLNDFEAFVMPKWQNLAPDVIFHNITDHTIYIKPRESCSEWLEPGETATLLSCGLWKSRF